MKKFTTWLEDRFVPVMNKANGDIWVLTCYYAWVILLLIIYTRGIYHAAFLFLDRV